MLAQCTSNQVNMRKQSKPDPTSTPTDRKPFIQVEVAERTVSFKTESGDVLSYKGDPANFAACEVLASYELTAVKQ